MFFSTAAAILSLYDLSSNTVAAHVSNTNRLEGWSVGFGRIRELTEGELLEGAAAGLGVQEEDDDELEEDPAAVDGEVLPLEGVERDGVNVGGEEARELSENLLHTDATAALGIRPELDKIG